MKSSKEGLLRFIKFFFVLFSRIPKLFDNLKITFCLEIVLSIHLQFNKHYSKNVKNCSKDISPLK